MLQISIKSGGRSASIQSENAFNRVDAFWLARGFEEGVTVNFNDDVNPSQAAIKNGAWAVTPSVGNLFSVPRSDCKVQKRVDGKFVKTDKIDFRVDIGQLVTSVTKKLYPAYSVTGGERERKPRGETKVVLTAERDALVELLRSLGKEDSEIEQELKAIRDRIAAKALAAQDAAQAAVKREAHAPAAAVPSLNAAQAATRTPNRARK